MIIRLFRYEVRPGALAAFEAATTGEGASAAARTAGLRFAYAARDASTPGRGLVLTGWDSFDAVAARAPELVRPAFLPPGAEALLATSEVSHWEALDLPAIGSGEPPEALRVLTGRVDARLDATYFAHVRETVWPSLGSLGGLTGAWMGRQVDGGAFEPVLAASAWSPAHARDPSGGRDPMVDGHDELGLHVDGDGLFEVFARTGAP